MLWQVLASTNYSCSISSDNIDYKFLTTVGWTGVVVGNKNNNATIPQSASLVGFDDRSVLGTDRPLVHFQSAIKRMIAEFQQSGGRRDLVFSPELTHQERGIIIAEAGRNHLECQCYHRGHHGGDVYVVVSFRRSPLELVKFLLENGGETSRYRLLSEPI